jgi:hypothetical protein
MELDLKRNIPGVLIVIKQWIEEHTPNPSRGELVLKLWKRRSEESPIKGLTTFLEGDYRKEK